MWEDLLLKANKDHLLSQSKSELMRQEHQGGSLNNCHQWVTATLLMLKDWNHNTHNTDTKNLDESKYVNKKNYIWRKRLSEDTQIRSMYEMGEMKRAQELRVDEVLVQKLTRKPWDNTEAHFPVAGDARADEFYEWFGRISRSGIKLTITVGDCLTFPVSLQWVQVLVPCMLSRDKRLPLDT